VAALSPESSQVRLLPSPWYPAAVDGSPVPADGLGLGEVAVRRTKTSAELLGGEAVWWPLLGEGCFAVLIDPRTPTRAQAGVVEPRCGSRSAAGAKRPSTVFDPAQRDVDHEPDYRNDRNVPAGR